MHGFRIDGPYAGRPAYDVIQGLSGSADLMARLVGEPRYMPTIMADKTCGLVTANAILAALFERQQSGMGQFVEVPMFETMVAFNMADHIFGHAFEPPESQWVIPASSHNRVVRTKPLMVTSVCWLTQTHNGEVLGRGRPTGIKG